MPAIGSIPMDIRCRALVEFKNLGGTDSREAVSFAYRGTGQLAFGAIDA